jgi:hypothetical protein
MGGPQGAMLMLDATTELADAAATKLMVTPSAMEVGVLGFAHGEVGVASAMLNDSEKPPAAAPHMLVLNACVSRSVAVDDSVPALRSA